jgi:hypothetical protein
MPPPPSNHTQKKERKIYILLFRFAEERKKKKKNIRENILSGILPLDIAAVFFYYNISKMLRAGCLSHLCVLSPVIVRTADFSVNSPA